MRTRTNEDYAAMTQQQVQDSIAQLVGESNNCSETAHLNGLKDCLKRIEQTRHLMIWADNSTLLNNGYLLLTVNVVYDEALFFTDKEIEVQGKAGVDVQSIVER